MSEINFESTNQLPSGTSLRGNKLSAGRQSNSLPRTLNQQQLELKAQFSNSTVERTKNIDPSDYKTNMMILPNIQINSNSNRNLSQPNLQNNLPVSSRMQLKGHQNSLDTMQYNQYLQPLNKFTKKSQKVINQTNSSRRIYGGQLNPNISISGRNFPDQPQRNVSLSMKISEVQLPHTSDYEQQNENLQELSKFRKRVISRQHQKQSLFSVSSGEVDVSQTPVITSTQKSQRQQFLNQKPSDYIEGPRSQALSKKLSEKKQMLRNNGLSKSIDTMSKEEIKKLQQNGVFNTIEKEGRNNRRRMVYSNDIYGISGEVKNINQSPQTQFNSKYLKQFQTQDKIFQSQNPYLDTDHSIASKKGNEEQKSVQSMTRKSIQKLEPAGGVVNPVKTEPGIVPGQGAAVGVGYPGIMQPFQLLKYSAISRCGMVLKQIITSSGDKQGKQIQKSVLAPKINQDSFKVIKAFPSQSKQFNWLFAIFDGHGPNGEVMSQYSAQFLPDNLNPILAQISTEYTKPIQELQLQVFRIKNNPGHHSGNIQQLQDQIKNLTIRRTNLIVQALENSFNETDRTMQAKYCQEPNLVDLSGCTATVLLIQEDYFVVANCGDSPIYVFRDNKTEVFKGDQLSVDHKPDNKEETERILATGGVLDQFQSAATGKKIGPMRVWSKESRQPGLAMSRSLGDAMAKRCGVISNPTVRIIPRDRHRDRALLVCSDGISDQVSLREMEETISFYYRNQDTENCCKQLVESATEKWHNKHNMQDDITSIVIFMR